MPTWATLNASCLISRAPCHTTKLPLNRLMVPPRLWLFYEMMAGISAACPGLTQCLLHGRKPALSVTALNPAPLSPSSSPAVYAQATLISEPVSKPVWTEDRGLLAGTGFGAQLCALAHTSGEPWEHQVPPSGPLMSPPTSVRDQLWAPASLFDLGTPFQLATHSRTPSFSPCVPTPVLCQEEGMRL